MASMVNISFDEEFLARIDQQAQIESRNRSELLREAVRMYLERREKWSQLFTLGNHVAKMNKLAEADVAYETQAVRKNKRNRKIMYST